MTNNERETLYRKLMSILMLMEDKNSNRGAILELESLIEFVKFSQVE
jgi:hypothetical protein